MEDKQKYCKLLDNIYSFLHWNGFLGKNFDEKNKYIFNCMNLKELCTDPMVTSHYTSVDKNASFWKDLKKMDDYEEFRKYVTERLMISAYRTICEHKFNIEINEKRMKLEEPEFYYNYYLPEKHIREVATNTSEKAGKLNKFSISSKLVK